MNKNSGIRTKTSEAMRAIVDEALAREGFSRKRGTLAYRRKFNESEQTISFVIICFPQYQPSMDVHIQPWVQIRLPALTEISLRLLRGDKALLANCPELILNQPVDFLAPKDHHHRWFAKSSEEYLEICKSILSFLQEWALPFLSELSKPTDLVKLYQTHDARVLAQKHWYVFVVAALISLGERERALDVAQREFAAPLLRKRYASLFESLADPKSRNQ